MFATFWSIPLLGTVILLAVVGVMLLMRAASGRKPLSGEERDEMASSPMPPLQKRAWLGLLISVATFLVIAMILFDRGAAEYWDNDSLRLTVVGIFIGGMVIYTGVFLASLVKMEREGRVDERDRAILARAPNAQSIAVILSLAAWLIYLAEKFHDQGTVPVVYLYLIFGSSILVTLIGQSLGVLLGYWVVARYGQS